MEYEILESSKFPGHWHVEATDEEGCVSVAIFSGLKAEKRAFEYADWVGRQGDYSNG